jgi:ribonuclease HI
MLRNNVSGAGAGNHERPGNWTPPPQGWVKLNTDVSFLSAEGASGVGDVLRDHHGKVLLAACSPIPRCIDAMDAEAMVVLWGINLLRGLGHSRVILEADNATVVGAALRSKELDRSRSWATYDQIKRWLSDLDDDCVTHKSRDSNRVADALAKMARSAGSCLWFDMLPDNIWELVTRDLVPVVTSII